MNKLSESQQPKPQKVPTPAMPRGGLLRIDVAKVLIFIETIIKLHKKFTLMWGERKERGEKLGEASGGLIFFD